MTVPVAVAIITDKEQRFLITQRPLHVDHGGMWEFPGGKLEEGETPTAALVREIKEELGIDILFPQFIGQINHTYDHALSVSLLVYHISHFQGVAACKEKQMDMRWVKATDFIDYEFPAANKQIVELISTLFCTENKA